MTNPGSHPPEHDLDARRRGERRLWLSAFFASALVHLVVLLVLGQRSALLSPFSAAGPRENDPLARGGSVQAVSLREPPPVSMVPPPLPLPTLEEVDPVEFEPEVVDEPLAPAEEGTPGGGDPGTDQDSGRGDGGDSGEGLNRLIPPTPRGMIIPPTNEDVEGSEVEVWVFVNEEGRVVPDSTRLVPPTADRGFNERLIEQAAEWVFVPARRGGVPVATWFPYVISM